MCVLSTATQHRQSQELDIEVASMIFTSLLAT